MEEEKLSEKQERAIELALSGMSDGEIAKEIKVSRQWVNTWRNHDDLFMEALDARRSALKVKHIDSINGLVLQSIAVLREALEDEDRKTRLQAAKLVLSMAALKDAVKAGKPQSKDEIIKEFVEGIFGKVSEELGYTDPTKRSLMVETPLIDDSSTDEDD